eukprot:COSAG01_NODE_36314_length_519_cov_1.371429_1_plen_66_part_00
MGVATTRPAVLLEVTVVLCWEMGPLAPHLLLLEGWPLFNRALRLAITRTGGDNIYLPRTTTVDTG